MKLTQWRDGKGGGGSPLEGIPFVKTVEVSSLQCRLNLCKSKAVKLQILIIILQLVTSFLTLIWAAEQTSH